MTILDLYKCITERQRVKIILFTEDVLLYNDDIQDIPQDALDYVVRELYINDDAIVLYVW